MHKIDHDEREVPCSECTFSNECAIKLLECVAIRQWYYNGKYDDKDVGRLRRVMKNK